jgi:hypothetical protein
MSEESPTLFVVEEIDEVGFEQPTSPFDEPFEGSSGEF